MGESFNIGGKTYVRHFGIDWDPSFTRVFAALSIAKKHKLMKDDLGITPDVSPGDCLEEGLKTLFGDSLIMTEWTKNMIHDSAETDYYAMIGCAACGKSHALAAIGIGYWLVDPYDTAVIVGSATLKDLATRAWAPILELFTVLQNNELGLSVPGKIVHNAYAVQNIRDPKIPESMTSRGAIQGRALDEGRIQGTHPKWCMLIVDELGLITDLPGLKTSLANVRTGTLGFKFLSAANPNPWDSPNSQFYMPKKGDVVNEHTGVWESAMGYRVRHFNGYNSPVVKNPLLQKSCPFLMTSENIAQTLRECNEDANHPRMWKMVIGFPLPSGSGSPPILDPLVASQNQVTAPLPPPMMGSRLRIGMAAGVDPAWSAHGDDAVYAGVEVVEQDGRPYLDFSGRTHRLPISTSTADPVTLQLRRGVSNRMVKDGGPTLDAMYVDSSGNQGLADDIDIYLGPGCGHINNSVRASDKQLRAYDQRPTKDFVKDRGTEAWMVLAEFCKAGMVRGLTPEALSGLTQRRFATRPGSDDPVTPLRMEAKDDFIKRFRGSPNETDACALAALAVKERFGIVPFGTVAAAVPEGMFPAAYGDQQVAPAVDYESFIPGEGYSDDFSDLESYDY